MREMRKKSRKRQAIVSSHLETTETIYYQCVGENIEKKNGSSFSTHDLFLSTSTAVSHSERERNDNLLR